MFVASHPEEIHQFRVVWGDDQGQLQMHRGFCVNYSASLGHLQGPLRFEATVNLDIIRFLGWEQLLKNAYLHQGKPRRLPTLFPNTPPNPDVLLRIKAPLAHSQLAQTLILVADQVAKS